jgi:hypothetical protein
MVQKAVTERAGNDNGSRETCPDIVCWDGPNDPENPLNWSGLKKNLHIMSVSIFTLYS